MAQFLYVTEYSDFGQNNFGPVPREPAIANQLITVTNSSVSSATFNAETRLIRICADTSCAYAFGVAPTATATSIRLPANVVEYHSIPSESTTSRRLQVAVFGVP